MRKRDRYLSRTARRRAQNHDLIGRMLYGLLGVVCMFTGIYGDLNFSPPVGADPGGVNAVRLTLMLMIGVGFACFAWSLRRLDRHIWR